MSKNLQRTPEQIALSEERKAKRQKLQDKPPPEKIQEEKGSILLRPWIKLDRPDDKQGARVKLLTWNLLAQCLVRK